MKSQTNTSLPLATDTQRIESHYLHLLSDILLISLCTHVTGGSDYQDMHIFSLERGSLLSSILSLSGRVPSENTFKRVFKSLNFAEFEAYLKTYGDASSYKSAQKNILITKKEQNNKDSSLLNFWVSENRFRIVRKKVENKSYEVTAIPAILSTIDIANTVISVDALGTEREIIESIIKRGGHYFLAIKSNHDSLYRDIESAFKIHTSYDSIEKFNHGHGRIETRKCSILSANEVLLNEHLQLWKSLNSLIRIESTWESQGKTTRETSYYISDEPGTDIAYFSSLISNYRRIENKTQWYLDITFKEDPQEATGHAPENLTAIKRLALQIIFKQRDALSIKKRFYKAALDVEYLKKIIAS